MEKLLTYALNGENELISVTQVKNGLACNCICPDCKHPLVAKNNPTNKKASHFAHASGRECQGAYESALHLLAKAVLFKHKRIALPAFHHDYNTQNKASFFKWPMCVEFDSIILEESLIIESQNIIPDTIGIKGGKRVLIEFAKTHFVDEQKRTKLQSGQEACIEIDIRELPLDEEAILEALLNDSSCKYWVVNKYLEQQYCKYKELKDRKEIEEQRKRHEAELEARRKRQADIDDNKRINSEKIRRFPLNGHPKPLRVVNGKVQNCPLKKMALAELPFRFHRIPEIQRILQGAYWDLKIYRGKQNGRYIFLSDTKGGIYVYPPDNQRDFNDKELEKGYSFFYAALQEIKNILTKDEFGDCSNCKHFVDRFYEADKDYRVCNHKDA